MSASPEEHIAINSLLIEREAAFARVHSIESQIQQLMGADYPFQAPGVELPSAIKKQATKPKQAKKKVAKVKTRRLGEGEAGYKLTFVENGDTTERITVDLKQIQTLLNDPLPGVRLLRIDTVDLEKQTVDTLFEVGA